MLSPLEEAFRAELAPLVAHGARLLDHYRPEWAKKISLERLAMDDCDRCVLGQLFGDYSTGKEELELTNGCMTGFSVPIHEEYGDLGYKVLRDLWTVEIYARRATSIAEPSPGSEE